MLSDHEKELRDTLYEIILSSAKVWIKDRAFFEKYFLLVIEGQLAQIDEKNVLNYCFTCNSFVRKKYVTWGPHEPRIALKDLYKNIKEEGFQWFYSNLDKCGYVTENRIMAPGFFIGRCLKYMPDEIGLALFTDDAETKFTDYLTDVKDLKLHERSFDSDKMDAEIEYQNSVNSDMKSTDSDWSLNGNKRMIIWKYPEMSKQFKNLETQPKPEDSEKENLIKNFFEKYIKKSKK